MKKILKWSGIIFGGLICIIVLAGLALYPVGMKKLTHIYPDIAVEAINIPADAEAIERGKHTSVIWGCTSCHGADLGGNVLEKDPLGGGVNVFSAIPASNLTRGKGGIGGWYADTDWIRSIRHGIKPDHKGIIFMDYQVMSDRDLSDLIAYLKQVPPVDRQLPAIHYGPIIPIIPALGIYTPAAASIDHKTLHPADVAPNASIEYGKYLSANCIACHGSFANSLVRDWKRDDFIQAFTTGVMPNGRKFGATMTSAPFRQLTNKELEALWLYFTSNK